MAEFERIYECEVERRRQSSSGGYEPFWKVKAVADAIQDGDVKFRCKDCHGAVRLHGKNVAHGPTPHVEHRFRQDSEYCPAGMYFRDSKDGRTPRLSLSPVR